LKLLGETVMSDPKQSSIGIGGFGVVVGWGCSGIAGMVMVSAVMAGYILASKKRLKIGGALMLIPLAAGLSWALNAVRITVLLLIGAHVSPQLAVDGFHSNAGWIAFCTLSAAMLFIAENMSWIHRRTAPVAAPTTSVLTDPTVAQIAPFVVLLLSSLLSGAVFLQPESGYPLRFFSMAAALLLFWNRYRAEIGAVDAIPFLAGAVVALVWLGVKAGGSPFTLADILGPASQGAVTLWVLFRVLGTVLLVPFIEEMFFRGYLLHRLDFGGVIGKITALAVSSALFGALHSNFLMAAASGLLFGMIARRRERVFDAVVAHTTANGAIAAWAMSTGDWSVI
jgi:exosortase E/protease (VPEID-CTERM system)